MVLQRMEKMNELSTLLRKLRGRESLRDVAKRAGISHSQISNLEKGIDSRTGNPVKTSPETLKSLAAAYGYPYGKLMELAGYIPNQAEQKERMTSALADDPELLEFFEDLSKRDALKILLRQTKDLEDTSIKFIIKVVKAVQDEEDTE